LFVGKNFKAVELYYFSILWCCCHNICLFNCTADQPL